MTTVVVVQLILAAAAIAAAVITAVALYHWIADRRAAASRSLPPLFVIPMTHAEAQHSLIVVKPPRLRESVNRGSPVNRATPVNGGPPVNREPPVARPRPTTPPRAPVAVLDDVHDDTNTVRFVRPVDEPVQLLPGRLEVLAGDTPHHEIRFVRVRGEPLQLILGRDAGPSPQYVGLGSTTVSRRHARLSYAEGRWVVKNLSQTNPLVVNDDELSDTDAERPLVDGDRLELGEVVLRFHAH